MNIHKYKPEGGEEREWWFLLFKNNLIKIAFHHSRVSL